MNFLTIIQSRMELLGAWENRDKGSRFSFVPVIGTKGQNPFVPRDKRDRQRIIYINFVPMNKIDNVPNGTTGLKSPLIPTVRT